ncbi:AAA family ATPase, partial [Richelia intracellularis]|uniref:AAA family ATPase n=1 Tax=Richelia intracellularis TaxID=1164990 RepID=UPI0005C5E5D8
TETIRRRPYAVILFDEIEKAHPDVFNIFLQILDDGRVTDAQGHTVSFKNAIIIMTSNIGSQYILDVAGDDSRYDEMQRRVMGTMRTSFRPEFLNRVDEIIIFHALLKEQLQEIVGLQVEKLRHRLTDRKISLKLSNLSLEFIVGVGFDPVFGARPLKRVIQRELETPIAKLILQGELSDGDVVYVDVENERLSFKCLPVESIPN